MNKPCEAFRITNKNQTTVESTQMATKPISHVSPIMANSLTYTCQECWESLGFRSMLDSRNAVFKDLTARIKNTMFNVTLMKNGTKKNNISGSFRVIQQPRPPNCGASDVSAADKPIERRIIVKIKGRNQPINRDHRSLRPFWGCRHDRLLLNARQVSPAAHAIQTKEARKAKYFNTPRVKHRFSTSLAGGLSSNKAMAKAIANTRLNCIRPGNDLYCCQRGCKMTRQIRPSSEIKQRKIVVIPDALLAERPVYVLFWQMTSDALSITYSPTLYTWPSLVWINNPFSIVNADSGRRTPLHGETL